MLLALYGHPDSGGIWERYFEENIGKNGWTPVLKEIWRHVFYHRNLHLLLVVYVDGLKMAGPKENLSKGWRSIAEVIDIDTPEPFGSFLVANIELRKTHQHRFGNMIESIRHGLGIMSIHA